MKTCIQIGLDRTAEYAYVVRDDWSTYIPTDPDKALPSALKTQGNWQYIGIDMSVESVRYVESQYPYNDRIKWCCATMGLGVGETSLDDLFKVYTLDKLEVLAIDIEGMEFPLFEHFQWTLKPVFMAVEVHPSLPVHVQELVDTIVSQGYKCTKRSPMHGECQFIRVI